MEKQAGFGDRDIGIYYWAKGRKLAQISMVLKDVPGSQSRTLSILAEHGIDLKLGWFDTTERGVTGRYSAFVDMTGCKADVKEIREQIMATKLVYQIEIQTAKDVIFDAHFKGLRMTDRDIFPIGLSEWSEMKRNVNPKVLRNMGRSVGEVIADYWLDAMGDSSNSLSLWERILESRSIGDRVTIDVGKGLVTIENCFASREYRAGRPSCYEVCGILEGILSQILVEKVKVEEVECLANYEQRCVFKIDLTSTKKLRDFEKISERLDSL